MLLVYKNWTTRLCLTNKVTDIVSSTHRNCHTRYICGSLNLNSIVQMDESIVPVLTLDSATQTEKQLDR